MTSAGKSFKKWSDGSEYEGLYEGEVRHGFGCQKWTDGEFFLGEFCKDHFHGYGIYRWPNGYFYAGTFFMDDKEGCGLYFYGETCYMGMFSRNNAKGLGLKLHLKDNPDYNHFDFGVWLGNTLIRIFADVKNYGFVNHLSKLIKKKNNNESKNANSDNVKNTLTLIEHFIQKQEHNFSQELIEIYLKKLPKLKLTVAKDSIFVNDLPRKSYSINNEVFNTSFANCSDSKHPYFEEIIKEIKLEERMSMISSQVHAEIQKTLNGQSSSNKDPSLEMLQILNYNRTASCLNMQALLLKHHNLLFKHFPILKTLVKNRDSIYKSGNFLLNDKQSSTRDSVEFLAACLSGKIETVKKFLKHHRVHVDVADCYGNTGLIGAAVRGHNKVVDLLLDSGAEIDKVNDSGFSPLMIACYFHFLKYNDKRMKMIFNEDNSINKNSNINNDNEVQSRKSDLNDNIYYNNISNHNNNKLYNNVENKNNRSNNIVTNADNVIIEKFGTLENLFPIKRQKSNIPIHLQWDSLLINEHASNNSNSNNNNNDNNSKLKNVGRNINGEDIVKHHVNIDDIHKDHYHDNPKHNNVDNHNKNKSVNNDLNTNSNNNNGTDLSDTIKLLLKRGADVNLSNDLDPVLFLALRSNDVRMVELMVERGADVNVKCVGYDYDDDDNDEEENSGDDNGCRCFKTRPPLPLLHHACSLRGRESVDICNLLLKAGADVNGCIPAAATTDVTALVTDEAIQIIPPILKSPIRYGGNDWATNITNNGSINVTAVTNAISTANDINNNINSNINNNKNYWNDLPNLLEIVCSRSNNDDNDKFSPRLLQLLIDYNVDVNKTFDSGHTALSLCIQKNNLELVKVLLDNYADVNALLGHNLQNVLCVAVENRGQVRFHSEQIQLIDLLINYGADVNAQVAINNNDGSVGNVVDYLHHLHKLEDDSDKNTKSETNYHETIQIQKLRQELLNQLSSAMRDKINVNENNNKTKKGRKKRKYILNNFTESGLRNTTSPSTPKPPPSSLPPAQPSLSSPAQPPLSSPKQSSQSTKQRQNRQPSSSKFCYECGRSLVAKLSPCPRCNSVLYCSKICKEQSWKGGHKLNCTRSAGTMRSALKKERHFESVQRTMSNYSVRQLALPPAHQERDGYSISNDVVVGNYSYI